MENFTFHRATRIIFGKDKENEVGKEAAALGRKALLLYGGGSIKRSGLYDRVRGSLTEAGLDFIELSGVEPNPRIDLIREGIRLCRGAAVDHILAVGGGSVIDTAKGIAAGMFYDGDAWDFYTHKVYAKQALPTGAVITAPGSGAEVSGGSVVTDAASRRKLDMGAICLYPRFAIVNPELSFTLNPYQTACGVADVMSHVLERYFTPSREVDLTDRLCEATLQALIEAGPVALRRPQDYDARAQIMWGSTVAQLDILDTGRVSDWASHKIEHEVSGVYDVAHGAGLAVIFPAWMRYVYQKDIPRFARYAVRVWGVQPRFDAAERTALEGIERTRAFFKSLGLPTSLKELDVPADRLDEMAANATWHGPVGKLVKLEAADVRAIYDLAR